MKKKSLERAKEITDFVVSTMTELKGTEWVEERYAFYEKQGYKTREAQIEEFVADSMFDVFSSERAVKEFVQKDRTFAQKVFGHIKRIVADIKNIFNKLVASGNYDEISAWQSDMEALDKLNNMMLDALAEIEQSETQAQKNTSEEVKNSAKRNPAQSKYENDVDAVINGTYNSDSALIMGVTPQIYQEFGFSKLPIAITKNHVYSIAVTEQQAKADGRYNKNVNYHGLGVQAVKDIYQNISDPIMVIASPDFQSKAQRESVHKVIAIVDLQVDGKQVIAPIEIDAEVENNNFERIDVNLVSSYFDKSNLNKMLSEAVALESIGDVGFYYVDENRAEDIFKKSKVQYLSRLDSFNSNGIIHTIDEKVNRKIDDILKSKQFIRWFGDWQNKPEAASKIVNADGTPKVMYHGTQSSFTAFDKKKAKSYGYYGKGFYFTESESHAKQYGNSMAVYLDVKNPLEQGKNSISKKQLRKFLEAVAENEDYDIWNYGTEDISEIVDSIYKNDAFSVLQDVNATAIGDFAEAIALFNKVNKTNYDGIVTPTETVVYEPTQIKSATDNIGTFDGDNEDVRFSTKRAGDKAKSPDELTESDVKSFLTQAIEGKLHEGTYFPVRRNTPKILIDSALTKNGDVIENLPIIIQVKKSVVHNISADDMISIIKAMDDPQYIIYQEDNDRYVEVVKYDTSKGSKAVAVLEIGDYKSESHLNGYKGGSYNVLVTAFEPNATYVSDVMSKSTNAVIYEKKKGSSQVTSGSTVPSVLNESPFADSITQKQKNVNGDEKFSTKRDADYMTAVESGDVVPLSKRFDDSKDDIRYSVKRVVDDNGSVYENTVVLDTNIFDKKKTRNWGKTLQQFVYNNLVGEKVVLTNKDNQEKVIEFAKGNERVKKDGAKNEHRVIDKLARKKDMNSQLAVAHSIEIISVMNPTEQKNDHSHQWLDENGWDYYKAILMQRNGKLFEATINVAKAKDGRNILYDINKIKEIGHGVVFSKTESSQRNSHINSDFDDEIVTQNKEIVNTKSSTKRETSVSEDASNYILDTKEYKEVMKLVDQRYRLTGKKKLDAKAIDRFAGRLLSKAQSQYSREQLTERLSALFDYIANSGNDVSWDSVMEVTANIASDILKQSQSLDRSMTQEYKDTRDWLRGLTVYISPEVEIPPTSPLCSTRITFAPFLRLYTPPQSPKVRSREPNIGM